MKKIYNNNRIMYIIMIGAVVLVLIVMVVFNFLLSGSVENQKQNVEYGKEYQYHVAMISGDSDDEFWISLYRSAAKVGAEKGVYLENFGEEFKEDYTTEFLMKMAIAAKVDGIIVKSGKSKEMQDLIEEAYEQGIPVVTIQEDCPGSKRISYVGANEYTLGEMYGKEIEETAQGREIQASVVIQVNPEDSTSNYVYSGISEYISAHTANVQLSTVKAGGSGEFESEESIRNLLLDEETRPDVLVCLSLVDTISAYQCVIDYNLVGKVEIIGYYQSKEILEGISKGIIRSSIMMDVEEMADFSVRAIREYLSQEYINEYFPVSAELIDQENVTEYMRNESED